MLSQLVKKIAVMGVPFVVILAFSGCSDSGNVKSTTGAGGAGGTLMPSFATSNYSAVLAGGSIPTASEGDAVVGAYPTSGTSCSADNSGKIWAAPLLALGSTNSLLTMTAADTSCALSIKSFIIKGSANSGTYEAGTVSGTSFTPAAAADEYMPVSIVTSSGIFSATQDPIAFSNCGTPCSGTPLIIYAKASIFWTETSPSTATINIVFADTPSAVSGTGKGPTTSVVSVTGGGVSEVPTPNYNFSVLPQLTVDAASNYQGADISTFALKCIDACSPSTISDKAGGATSYTVIPVGGSYTTPPEPDSYPSLFDGVTPTTAGYDKLNAYYKKNKTLFFKDLNNDESISLNTSDFISGVVGAKASDFGKYNVPNSIPTGGFTYYILIVNDLGSGKPPAFEVAKYTQPK